MKILVRESIRAALPFRWKRIRVGALAAALGVTGATSIAAAGESGPTTMKLPATGLSVDLPTGWVARETVFKVSNAPKGAPGTDLITRIAAGKPTLFFTLVSFGGHTCKEWSTQIGAADPTSKPVKSPAYLPTGWDTATIVGPTEGRPSNITTGFCLDSLTGVVLGNLEYKGSLNDADLGAVTPVLVSIAKSAGVDSRAVAAPPALTPPPPPSVPSVASTPTTPPPALTPPPPPPPTPPAVIQPIPPPAPPPPEPEEHDDPDSYSRAPDPEATRFELALSMVQPSNSRPKAFMATLGLDGAKIKGGDRLGFAFAYGVSLGITSNENVPFDARFGIGFGLKFKHLRIIPLAGLGLDTIGGSSASSFKVPLAFYWYIEGRLRVTFGSIAVEGIAARQVRGSISGDPDAVAYENRFGVLLVKQFDDAAALSVGPRFTVYDGAFALGGVAAVSF